jgi:hypothetical protein
MSLVSDAQRVRNEVEDSKKYSRQHMLVSCSAAIILRGTSAW